MDEMGLGLFTRFREIQRSHRIDPVGILPVGLASVYVGVGGTVENDIKTSVAEVFLYRVLICEVELVQVDAYDFRPGKSAGN